MAYSTRCENINQIYVFNVTKPCYVDLKIQYNRKIGYITKNGVIRTSSRFIDCPTEPRIADDIIIQKIMDQSHAGDFQVHMEVDNLDIDFEMKTYEDAFINKIDYNTIGSRTSRMFEDIMDIFVLLLVITSILIRSQYLQRSMSVMTKSFGFRTTGDTGISRRKFTMLTVSTYRDNRCFAHETVIFSRLYLQPLA
jgi:hypothetical protein